MKRVLFIAYYIPPAGGAGVQRSTKFIKYLPDFGWQPVVLTVHPRNYRLQDPSLNSEIPSQTPINRTSAIHFPAWTPWRVRNWISRWILTLDENLGWYPAAVRTGKKLITYENISAIYTTSPPYTDHLIGYALKRHSRLPWIADFRDPWIGNFSRQHPTAFHRNIDARWEARVVRTADQVIVVTPTMGEDLLVRYPGLAPEKITLLPNGFDSQDFNGIPPISLSTNQFNIVYTGSFYGRQLTPHSFLQALAKSFDNGRLPRASINVSFIGNIGQPVQDMIDRTGLSDLVKITGYLPHHQSIANLLAGDLLLLIIGSSPASRGIYTGKIFEYLAAGKPILALAPEGVAADLVREAQAGVVVPPDDIPAIADALVEMYTRWSRGELNTAHRPEVVARYERRNLTARLAAILDNLSPPEAAYRA